MRASASKSLPSELVSRKEYDCSNQGIQAGWSDLYGNSLDCQWLDVTDVPPGDYFLAALTDLDRSELYTPAFLRELVPAAIRLTLAEGERKVQNVQIK